MKKMKKSKNVGFWRKLIFPKKVRPPDFKKIGPRAWNHQKWRKTIKTKSEKKNKKNIKFLSPSVRGPVSAALRLRPWRAASARAEMLQISYFQWTSPGRGLKGNGHSLHTKVSGSQRIRRNRSREYDSEFAWVTGFPNRWPDRTTETNELRNFIQNFIKK